MVAMCSITKSNVEPFVFKMRMMTGHSQRTLLAPPFINPVIYTEGFTGVKQVFFYFQRFTPFFKVYRLVLIVILNL